MDVQTKTKLLHLSAVLLALILLLSSAFAEVVQPNDDFWYLDEANVLSEATEGEIFFANQRLYDTCGAEIVVVAIDSTGNMAIDDYAYTLFNDWEIGGNSYRGMLLLMAIKDDDYYAMPGTNMGHLFDSATLNQMLKTYLEPDFAAKNYDKGAQKFFEAVYEKTVDDLNLDLSIADAKAEYNAFLQNPVTVQDGTTANVGNEPTVYITRGESTMLPTIILLLIALLLIRRSFRTAPRHTRRSGVSPMAAGFVLGRMTSNRHRHHSPGIHPHMGRRPPTSPPGGRPGNAGRSSGSSFGNGFTSKNSSGFSGARRSSGFSSPRSGGGFGGASRSGGASRGPSTRGGGSGRFSR